MMKFRYEILWVGWRGKIFAYNGFDLQDEELGETGVACRTIRIGLLEFRLVGMGSD